MYSTWDELSDLERHELSYLAGLDKGVIAKEVQTHLIELGLIVKLYDHYSTLSENGKTLVKDAGAWNGAG